MALEATHIRFAVEFKSKYRVQDESAYISGSIYPDSRYITNTERNLTHPRDFMSWDIAHLSDFKKGWYTHLLADQIQLPLIHELFPTLVPSLAIAPKSDIWIRLTAIKVLQDLESIYAFDIKKCLPDISYATAFNGEDKSLLAKYYQINRDFFVSPEAITLESYGIKLGKLGLNQDLADRVIVTAREYYTNQGIMSLIPQIYSQMLSRAAEYK
jgi:hypothetical protein